MLYQLRGQIDSLGANVFGRAWKACVHSDAQIPHMQWRGLDLHQTDVGEGADASHAVYFYSINIRPNGRPRKRRSGAWDRHIT